MWALWSGWVCQLPPCARSRAPIHSASPGGVPTAASGAQLSRDCGRAGSRFSLLGTGYQRNFLLARSPLWPPPQGMERGVLPVSRGRRCPRLCFIVTLALLHALSGSLKEDKWGRWPSITWPQHDHALGGCDHNQGLVPTELVSVCKVGVLILPPRLLGVCHPWPAVAPDSGGYWERHLFASLSAPIAAWTPPST